MSTSTCGSGTRTSDAVEPFKAIDRGRLWRGSLTRPRRPAEGIDPYPALVSLGTTPDGSIVLANLDALGHLDITGDPEAAARALSALGLELALAAADGALTLTVAADDASLVDAFVGDPVRRSADGVGNEVRSRMDSVAVALKEAHCADIRQARSQGACSDVQTEVVVSAHVHGFAPIALVRCRRRRARCRRGWRRVAP